MVLAAGGEQVGPDVAFERRGGGGLDLDRLPQPRLHRSARRRPGRSSRSRRSKGSTRLVSAEIRGRVGVETGRQRVLPPAPKPPYRRNQREPFPGRQHRDPHHRVVALAAAVVVDRVPAWTSLVAASLPSPRIAWDTDGCMQPSAIRTPLIPAASARTR